MPFPIGADGALVRREWRACNDARMLEESHELENPHLPWIKDALQSKRVDSAEPDRKMQELSLLRMRDARRCHERR